MVVVFGATGYTGRLVVDQLVARGLPVKIAGRSQERLEQISVHHGGLEWAVADVKEPDTLLAASEGADVLITTVGPFTWWGGPAAEAAVVNKVPYFDATGEPAFVKKIYDEYGPRAQAAGIPMLTAFGYDYVPGNLAGALALLEAGEDATRVDVGYFLPGAKSIKAMSGGTLRSLRASSGSPQFRFANGTLINERAAKDVFEFDVHGRKQSGITIGGSEHLSLPKTFPQLRDVNVALGWFGPASRFISIGSRLMEATGRAPFVRKIQSISSGGNSAGSRSTSGTNSAVKTNAHQKPDRPPTGPSDDDRLKTRTYVVAIARDQNGSKLSEVVLDGPGPYELTGHLLAWGADRAIAGAITATGAVGPTEAFTVDELKSFGESIGLVRV